MRILIDTQCWLWMTASPAKLSPRNRKLLLEPTTERFISTASVWEIAIKFAIGKLPLPAAPKDYVPSRLLLTQTQTLPISAVHALRVADLPAHHRDPFDRMLIAQALVETLPVLTADSRFANYGVEVIRA